MKKLIQMLAVSVLGLFMSTAIVFAKPAVIGTVEQLSYTVLCDTAEQLEHMLITQKENSVQAGVAIYKMYNSQLNDAGQPSCVFVQPPQAVTAAIGWLVSTIEDVNWFDGKQHTLYIIAILYEQNDGNWAEGFVYAGEAPVKAIELEPTGEAL